MANKIETSPKNIKPRMNLNHNIYIGKLIMRSFQGSFYQKKMIGTSRVAAKLNAAWASPSLAAPSPK